MPINFGRRQFISKRTLTSGLLISFGYNGERRIGVVIAPEYKDNCDCYVFDDLLEIPEELLTYIQETTVLRDGELWEQFDDLNKKYRSFKRSRMTPVQSIEFVTYKDNETIITKEQDDQPTASPLDNSRPFDENISE